MTLYTQASPPHHLSSLLSTLIQSVQQDEILLAVTLGSGSWSVFVPFCPSHPSHVAEHTVSDIIIVLTDLIIILLRYLHKATAAKIRRRNIHTCVAVG